MTDFTFTAPQLWGFVLIAIIAFVALPLLITAPSTQRKEKQLRASLGLITVWAPLYFFGVYLSPNKRKNRFSLYVYEMFQT